ncbi:MAG: hypothetical protein AM326_04100 [Candidatus Thorarchaeota archaeon SMTZ-45]|nr:MAG: hypothetical protein AM326_04100 [Candidatus Thorarchaeota archaeon SMTZ-45]KXH72600.1 MAG: hypothetical protein AM325_00790 [Candidatus Thorarchaeota archaeon SMTZ1-45]
MVGENSKAIVTATIIILAVFAAALLSMFNSDNPITTSNSSKVASLMICGNSSDLLYPELAEANFIFVENDAWQVSAHFVDDSTGYEYLEIYDRSFTITSKEVESINDALHEGLNQTYPSNITALELFEPESSPHMWYEIAITYTDGSWIYIITFQTEPGLIIHKSGTGNTNRNLLDGTVLEPLSALDGLVSAINVIFSNHL